MRELKFMELLGRLWIYEEIEVGDITRCVGEKKRVDWVTWVNISGPRLDRNGSTMRGMIRNT